MRKVSGLAARGGNGVTSSRQPSAVGNASTERAPSAEKPAIKAQLTELVSVAVDNGLSYMKDRIAAERANLDNWEAKVKEQEANLDEVKTLRVEDLLSGAAEKKHKAAKKAWKKQIKEAKKKVK